MWSALFDLPRLHAVRKAFLAAFEIGEFERREFEQLKRAGDRVVDVLVRERDVLHDRDEPVFVGLVQPPDQVRQGIEAGQRVQRAAVMAGRQVGGARHRERRCFQHHPGRHAFAQLGERAVDDLARRRILDELDQRFDRSRDTGLVAATAWGALLRRIDPRYFFNQLL